MIARRLALRKAAKKVASTGPEADKVLKPGGGIVIRFQGVGDDARTILKMFEQLGFRNVKLYGESVFEAVK